MKKNMGNLDRIIRLVIAAIVGFLTYNGTLSGVTGIVASVMAVVFALTSFISFCPIYTLLGMNTCPRK